MRHYLTLFFGVYVALLLCPVSVSGFSSVKDVLIQAINVHPEIRQAQAGVIQSRFATTNAMQGPNPELNSKSILGNYTELNLAHTFEMGNKQDIRLEHAQSGISQSNTKLRVVQEKVYLSTLLTLYRIRQIQAELSLLSETLSTFKYIQSQYRTRGRLTPEQQTLLSLFEISENQTTFQKTNLEIELDQEKRQMEFALGEPFNPHSSVLPPLKKQWPRLSQNSLSSRIQGTTLHEAQEALVAQQIELKTAQSLNYPDIKFGPTFEMGSTSGIGANIAFTAPLYHHYSGTQKQAEQGIEKARLALEAVEKEAKYQREFYFNQYQQTVEALEKSIRFEELNRKHQVSETLFDRGLLPGTLIIEVHRQLFELLKIYDIQELVAVSAWVRFSALNSRLFEEMPQ